MSTHPKPLPLLTESDIFRFWEKVNKDGPLPDADKYGDIGRCWQWTAMKLKQGYGHFKVSTVKPHRQILAHRISFDLVHGKLDESTPLILHRCDNPSCVNPGHLFAGTHKLNSDDKHSKDRANLAFGDRNGSRLHPERVSRGKDHYASKNPEIRQGARNGRAKLNDAQVVEIRSLYAAGGISQAAIGRQYGVNQGLISGIVLRKFWPHVA